MFKFAAERDVELIDTEVYGNYFLFAAKRKRDGRVWSIETKSRLSMEDRRLLRKFVEKRRTVGFNSRSFDLLIIYAAVSGLSTREIKGIADKIIVEKMRSWEVAKDFGIDVPDDLDHIDLIEVAPGKVGLKIYNGRLHGRRMQDLPYSPNSVLTDEEIEEVYRYCVNDLDATGLLYDRLREELTLRTSMSVEYGIDLRSKSDAQIAETVIKTQVSKLLGRDVKKPEFSPLMTFRYRTPEFIRFRLPQLKEVLRVIEEHKFRLSKSGKVLLPSALSEAHIHIGDGIYRMGIGGLHSSEDCVAVHADDEHILVDRDVTSYYPYIIMRLGLAPKQMGWAFQRVYKGIVDRRIAAKARATALKKQIGELTAVLEREGRSPDIEERLAALRSEQKKWDTIQGSLKITINGSFGKFGSVYSCLFSPDLLIQTTITGQLSLLMLIERLEWEGISVVSANTDGIVIRCPTKKIDLMNEIVGYWEQETGFGTEATEYKSLYSANVNNYIAIKANGEVKLKGYYARSGLMKNPENEICVDAVIDYITKGIPIDKTVRDCRDIRKFLTVRTVSGGAIWGVREVEYQRTGKRGQLLKPGITFDTTDAEYLGKAIRWYYSTEVEGSIHYQSNGNRVPRSEGARPLMELPDEFPDDVDFRWYVREAKAILREIGYYSDVV